MRMRVDHHLISAPKAAFRRQSHEDMPKTSNCSRITGKLTGRDMRLVRRGRHTDMRARKRLQQGDTSLCLGFGGSMWTRPTCKSVVLKPRPNSNPRFWPHFWACQTHGACSVVWLNSDRSSGNQSAYKAETKSIDAAVPRWFRLQQV